MPFTLFREVHWRHHAYLNRPDDPELWPYSDPNASLRFRRIFVWFDLFFGIITVACIFGRLYFAAESPIKSAKLRRTIFFEYVGIAIFWSFILWKCISSDGARDDIILLWLLPELVAGIFRSTQKFQEHLGLWSFDPLLGSRTIVGNHPVTRLRNFISSNLAVHAPHHRHPKMEHAELSATMKAYQKKNPGTPYPVFRSYWRAFLDVLPCLWKNPAVGVNVEATEPRVRLIARAETVRPRIRQAA